jgi:hypothetical protein
MPTIRHEINLINSAGTGANPPERIAVDTGKFNGSLSWYFEARGMVTDGTMTVTLKNEAGTTYATLTYTETASTIKRVECSTPLATGTYKVTMTKTGTTGYYFQGKVIVVQAVTGAITASESQVEMFGRGGTPVTSTDFVAHDYVKYWKYDSSKWDGTLSFLFSATMAVDSGGTCSVQLQEDDGSFANWADVTNGLLTTTAFAATLVTAGSAFTPTNGRHYRVVTKTSSASYSAYCYNAKIRVTQTGAAITKMEEQYAVMMAGQYLTGQKTYGTMWVSADWAGVTADYRYSHESNTNASAAAKLVDVDDGNADISGATATGAYQAIAASGFTMPDTGHRIVPNVTATNIHAVRVIVYVTYSDAAITATDTLLVKLTETAIATSIVLTATKDGAHIDLSWS